MMFRKTKAELVALVSSVDNRLSCIERRLSAKIEQQESQIKALCQMVADLEESVEQTDNEVSSHYYQLEVIYATIENKNKPAKPAKKKVSK